MNIGGYDKYSFNEGLGNRILSDLLESQKSIITHFSQSDKVPNFDGYFEILEFGEKKNNPIGRIDVQIKTLDHDYKNNNKRKNVSQYKYTCETKIFNAVKEALTLNPCFLFMVDIYLKKVFFKYISPQYVLSLEIADEFYKTIYFNDEDEIVNISSFYEIAKKIYKERALDLFSEAKNRFLTNQDLTIEEISILQEQFDYLNGIFETDLKFIKNKMFPEVWKFGIAYLKDENGIAIGVYWIRRGQHGEYFKQLNHKSYKDCFFITMTTYANLHIENLINKYIEHIIKKAYKNLIFPIEYASYDVLNEIIFYFLDRVAKIEKSYENSVRPYVYIHDEENVKFVELLYNAFYQYGYEKWKDILVRPEVDLNGIFLSDPIEDISHAPLDSSDRKLLQYVLTHLHDKEELPFEIRLHGKFEYSLIKEAIDELKRRNINKVYRLWKTENWKDFEQRRNVGMRRIENGYTIEDYFYNLRKLIKILPENYNNLKKKFESNDFSFNYNKKYIIAFSENEDFIIASLEYKSNDFIIEEDNSIMNYTNEQCRTLMSETNAISYSSGIYPHVFNIHFPLLTFTSNILYKKLAEKYGIMNIKLPNSNDIFF